MRMDIVPSRWSRADEIGSLICGAMGFFLMLLSIFSSHRVILEITGVAMLIPALIGLLVTQQSNSTNIK